MAFDFIKCVRDFFDANEFRGKKKVAEVEGYYRAMLSDAQEEGLSEAEGQARAAAQTLAEFDRRKAESVARKRAQLLATKNIMDAMESGRTRYGGLVSTARKRDKERFYGLTAQSLIARTPGNEHITNFEQLGATIERNAMRNLADLVEKYGPRRLGTKRPVADQEALLDEIFAPGSTGNSSAQAMAKAWEDTHDQLLRRAKLAGMTIYDRSDWRLPQSWSVGKLVRGGASAEADFVAFMTPRLDWKRVRFPSGERVLADKRDVFLREAFKTLSTDGAHKLGGAAVPGGSGVSNKARHRYIQYKDAQSWREGHERYGDGTNIFDAMVGHIQSRAHDIALVEIFGPNPVTGARFARDYARKLAADADVASYRGDGDPGVDRVSQVEEDLAQFDNMFDIAMRRNLAPEGSLLAATSGSLRQWATSAYLGSASISAFFGDQALSAFVARMNGLRYGEVLRWYGSQWKNGRDDAAMKAGLVIAEEQTSAMYATQRVLGQEVVGPRIARQMTDTAMRASGMTRHTRAARNAFRMEAMAAMARTKDEQWDSHSLRPMFDRYGVTQDEWEAFKSTPATAYRAVDFLDPGNASDLRLSEKFYSMIDSEASFAVPEVSLRSQAGLGQAGRAGTWGGELARTIGMFKNFPVTVMMTHVRRFLLEDRAMGAGENPVQWLYGHTARFALGMTLAGAFIVQTQNIINGRDPQNVRDPNFWIMAMARGGGLGIIGDFVFQDYNRYGQGVEEVVAGPLVGLLSDVGSLTLGNLRDALDGKDTKFAADLTQFARRNTPGSSLWQIRLVLNRMIDAYIVSELDPDAEAKFRRTHTNARKEFGQEYWWKRGEALPDRPPAVVDFSRS